MAAEGDLIRDGAGRSVDFGAVPLGGEGGLDGMSGNGLSYDQLHQVDCNLIVKIVLPCTAVSIAYSPRFALYPLPLLPPHH